MEILVTWCYVGEIGLGLSRQSDAVSNGERCNLEVILDARIEGETEGLGVETAFD